MNKLRLGKTGQMYIPNWIRKEIGINSGDLITVIMKKGKIILSNKDGFENENRCILSQNGTVHIPTEIRKFCNIDSETSFRVILNKKEKQICLSQEVLLQYELTK